jgi:hypothetical protein
MSRRPAAIPVDSWPPRMLADKALGLAEAPTGMGAPFKKPDE